MMIKMNIAITKMSSKGQVVIPTEMRGDISEGEKLIIIRNNHQIIMEKVVNLNKKLKEDLEFARRTEEAYRKYGRGEFTTSSVKDFLKELRKWQY